MSTLHEYWYFRDQNLRCKIRPCAEIGGLKCWVNSLNFAFELEGGKIHNRYSTSGIPKYINKRSSVLC